MKAVFVGFCVVVLCVWPAQISLIYDEAGLYQNWAFNRIFDPPTGFSTSEIRLGMIALLVMPLLAWMAFGRCRKSVSQPESAAVPN